MKFGGLRPIAKKCVCAVISATMVLQLGQACLSRPAQANSVEAAQKVGVLPKLTPRQLEDALRAQLDEDLRLAVEEAKAQKRIEQHDTIGPAVTQDPDAQAALARNETIANGLSAFKDLVVIDAYWIKDLITGTCEWEKQLPPGQTLGDVRYSAFTGLLDAAATIGMMVSPTGTVGGKPAIRARPVRIKARNAVVPMREINAGPGDVARFKAQGNLVELPAARPNSVAVSEPVPAALVLEKSDGVWRMAEVLPAQKVDPKIPKANLLRLSDGSIALERSRLAAEERGELGASIRLDPRRASREKPGSMKTGTLEKRVDAIWKSRSQVKGAAPQDSQVAIRETVELAAAHLRENGVAHEVVSGKDGPFIVIKADGSSELGRLARSWEQRIPDIKFAWHPGQMAARNFNAAFEPDSAVADGKPVLFLGTGAIETLSAKKDASTQHELLHLQRYRQLLSGEKLTTQGMVHVSGPGVLPGGPERGAYARKVQFEELDTWFKRNLLLELDAIRKSEEPAKVATSLQMAAKGASIARVTRLQTSFADVALSDYSTRHTFGALGAKSEFVPMSQTIVTKDGKFELTGYRVRFRESKEGGPVGEVVLRIKGDKDLETVLEIPLPRDAREHDERVAALRGRVAFLDNVAADREIQFEGVQGALTQLQVKGADAKLARETLDHMVKSVGQAREPGKVGYKPAQLTDFELPARGSTPELERASFESLYSSRPANAKPDEALRALELQDRQLSATLPSMSTAELLATTQKVMERHIGILGYLPGGTPQFTETKAEALVMGYAGAIKKGDEVSARNSVFGQFKSNIDSTVGLFRYLAKRGTELKNSDQYLQNAMDARVLAELESRVKSGAIKPPVPMRHSEVYGKNVRDVAAPKNDKATIDRMVRENEKLVHWVLKRSNLARSARQRNVDLDDVLQAGRIALFRAAAQYQPGQSAFSTFALPGIRQAMTREVMGWQETPLNNRRGTKSLSQPLPGSEDSSLTLGDKLSDEVLHAEAGWSSPESIIMEKHDSRAQIKTFDGFRDRLAPREREIFDSRILPGHENAYSTLGPLAKKWDVTTVRIGQIEHGLVRKFEAYRLKEPDLAERGGRRKMAYIPPLRNSEIAEPGNQEVLARYREGLDPQYKLLFDLKIAKAADGTIVTPEEVSKQTGIPSKDVERLATRMRARVKELIVNPASPIVAVAQRPHEAKPAPKAVTIAQSPKRKAEVNEVSEPKPKPVSNYRTGMPSGFKAGFVEAAELFAGWQPAVDRELFEKGLLSPSPMGVERLAKDSGLSPPLVRAHLNALRARLKLELPVIKAFLDRGIRPSREQVNEILRKQFGGFNSHDEPLPAQ